MGLEGAVHTSATTASVVNGTTGEGRAYSRSAGSANADATVRARTCVAITSGSTPAAGRVRLIVRGRSSTVAGLPGTTFSGAPGGLRSAATGRDIAAGACRLVGPRSADTAAKCRHRGRCAEGRGPAVSSIR